MEWGQPPSMEEVHEALMKRGLLKAELELKDNELKIQQARISKIKPRDTAARVIGIDEDTQKLLLELQIDIARLRGQISQLDGEIEFFQFHKEIFKAQAYRERY